jgi:putative membrane protein
MEYFPLKNIFFLTIPILIMIAVAVGVILLITQVVKKNNENASSFGSSRSAMRILDERFARGEIDEVEYIRKKDMLKRQ